MIIKYSLSWIVQILFIWTILSLWDIDVSEIGVFNYLVGWVGIRIVFSEVIPFIENRKG